MPPVSTLRNLFTAVLDRTSKVLGYLYQNQNFMMYTPREHVVKLTERQVRSQFTKRSCGQSIPFSLQHSLRCIQSHTSEPTGE